jgi:hypothetical protein
MRTTFGRLGMIASLLSCLALPARAAGDAYAPLKGLLGTWVVDRDCNGVKDRFVAVFKQLPKQMTADFLSAKNQSMGRADIVTTGEEDHYRVVTALPNNPVLTTLGVKSIGGSLTASTNEDEEDGLKNNYLTCSSQVSVLTSLVTIKLREKYKKATFLFTTESPLGKSTCRGSGTKQPAPKK